MAETTLDDLDSEQVAQSEEFLVDFLKSEYPSLDLTEGRVLRDLLIRPAALFHVLNQTDIDKLRRSMSMKAIEADPALADEGVVDGVLSNYRITRDPGAKAAGQVTLVVQNLLTTPVPQGTQFTANGLIFITTKSFVGVTTAEAVVSDQQRLLVARSDGTYSFIVDVEAQESGAAFVRRNTRFVVAPAVAGLIDAFATQDFTEGSAQQTNADLVALFKTSLAPKTFASRVHIDALLREKLPAITDVSIIGFADAEMLRDRHNIFELSHGGKSDLYTRTQVLPESRSVVKDAVLVDADAKLWQFTLGRDDAPGFYAVQAVLPENAPSDQGSYELNSVVPGMDLSVVTNEFVPDIDNVIEGGFSRYRTAVVKFNDPDTATDTLVVNESTRRVSVNVLVLPNLDVLQGHAVDRATRNPNGDYLVKAPAPALLAVSLKVLYRDGSERPDEAKLRTEIARRINATRFAIGRVSASLVHDAIHTVAGETDVLGVSPLDFFCQILKPDGTSMVLRSPNGIEAPDLPAEGITSRTTAFYLDEDDIDVAVEKVPARPV
jgi:hypothetical protein